ncbi:hypothetical protein SDC9_81869 [bioreactor metagenome]|uniref:Uncharacterized protein n=1 Tax=bioreactor metagenome TaxID=1076179 RepID=A0A644Z3Z6_9ZZZZ
MCPHAGEAGKQILILRQFDLCAGIGRSCPRRKNIKDKIRAVKNFALNHFFYVAELRWREFVVENNYINFVFLNIIGNFFKLPFTHKRASIRFFEALGEMFYHNSIGCASQKVEFIHVFARFFFGLRVGDKSYKNGFFLWLGGYIALRFQCCF